LFPLYLNAQGISVTHKDETCTGSDGSITVTLPDNGSYSVSINPSHPGSKNGNEVIFNGLSANTYQVKVVSAICPDKPLYNGSEKVNKEKPCTFSVDISIESKWTCTNPVTVLKANAAGGTPPYSYSWPNGTYSTSATGEVPVTVSATDSKGKTGSGKRTFYAGNVQCSSDPNEIDGPLGYGETQMISKTDRMEYTILYENDPDFATAPASRVKIVYLVEANQNINSFRIGDFGFGSFVFTVPQNTTSYFKRLDVSSSLGVWVDVTAGIDITKKELFWIFQSIDPQTGVEPVSAQMGYLPVNNKDIGNGEGYVNFSILPAAATQTGDVILAEADIVFDDNAAIATNVWSNTIDALPPHSTLSGILAADEFNVSLTFSGQDDENGSGIKNYRLYVSTNEQDYELYAYYLPDDICTFLIEEGYSYKFFAIAEDNAGNVEAMKSEADFATGTVEYQIITEKNIAEGGEITGEGIYAHGQAVTIETVANSGYVFSHWTVNNETISSESILNFVAYESNVYVANFLPQYQVTIGINPAAAGQAEGEGVYVYGDVVQVTATPNDQYRFVNWTKDSEVVSNEVSYDFTIYVNTGLTATFERDAYNVSVNSQTGGSTKGDTTGIYSYYDVLEIIALPEICYDFVDWTVNESSITGGTLRLTVTQDLDITANYVLKSSDVRNISLIICPNESYDFFGTNLTTSGTYEHVLQSIYGCDSTIVLTLTVLDDYPAVPTVSIEGSHTLVSSVENGNQWYNENGPVEGATSQSFTPAESGIYSVTASVGNCESEPSEQFIVNLSNQTNLIWNWEQGWSWLSENAADPLNALAFIEPIQTKVERLLSRNSELVKDPGNGFTGELTTLSALNAYKLKLNENGTKELSASIASTENNRISLQQGWNWIGYLPIQKLDLNLALSKLSAESGDVIKSQTDFSMFDQSWKGTLTSLEPGEGYIYYSASDKELEYSPLRVVKLIPIPEVEGTEDAPDLPWSFDSHQYPNNMNMIVRLYQDDDPLDGRAYTIGAFRGDECRGIGKYVEDLLFITIHGDEAGTPITFKAIKSNSSKKFKVIESVTFEETVLGNLNQPYSLTISEDTHLDIVDASFSIYPNPANKYLYIGGNVSKIKRIQILNITGEVLLNTDTFVKENALDVSGLYMGTYLIAIQTETDIYYHKFIKSK
jgi:hypothetical protein